MLLKGAILFGRKGNRAATMMVRLIACIGLLVPVSCREPLTPKPRGYFRIEFPEKSYEKFTSECRYSFEVPEYGTITKSAIRTAEKCWYDIRFDEYNATIYITYKPLQGNLPVHVEDVRKIVYKHIIKADDIIEERIYIPEKHVYGMLYSIEGNAASSMNFYVTDSSTGFVSGSLYFDVTPNRDSLAPAIGYFQQDVMHLINTFEWE